jgi:hypothetical protein
MKPQLIKMVRLVLWLLVPLAGAAGPLAALPPYGTGVPLAGAAGPLAALPPYGTGVPLAGAAGPVKFSDALYAKFQHARCLQCHQFNSRVHNGRAFNSHRSRYLCDHCHTSRITGLSGGEWMAPPQKMDWTGLSPRDTCLIAKQNMGGGDVNQKLSEHLLHDVRVHWALENGMTPGGKFPSVSGGYEAWARDIHTWVEGGMLCE